MVITLSVIASGGSLIDLDASLFVQLTVFLVTFLLLRQLLFKPMIRLIEARREATEGTREIAHKLDEEARELSDDVARQLLDIRTSASAERDRSIEQARREERDILVRAREEARALVEQAKIDTTEQGERVRQMMRAEVSAFAEAVAAKVLGGEA